MPSGFDPVGAGRRVLARACVTVAALTALVFVGCAHHQFPGRVPAAPSHDALNLGSGHDGHHWGHGGFGGADGGHGHHGHH